MTVQVTVQETHERVRITLGVRQKYSKASIDRRPEGLQGAICIVFAMFFEGHKIVMTLI